MRVQLTDSRSEFSACKGGPPGGQRGGAPQYVATTAPKMSGTGKMSSWGVILLVLALTLLLQTHSVEAATLAVRILARANPVTANSLNKILSRMSTSVPGVAQSYEICSTLAKPLAQACTKQSSYFIKQESDRFPNGHVRLVLHDVKIAANDESAVFRTLEAQINEAVTDKIGFVAEVRAVQADSVKTNVVLMLADDLGYGDVMNPCDGVQNNFESPCTPVAMVAPNLQAMMASSGTTTFHRAYTSPQCGPSRLALITGRETVKDPCRLRSAMGGTDVVDADGLIRLGGDSEISLGRLAKASGMRTFHAGKWHLGNFGALNRDTGVYTDLPSSSHPGVNGFDEWIATEAHVPTVCPNCACFTQSSSEILGHYNDSYWLHEYTNMGKKPHRFGIDVSTIPRRFPCDFPYAFGNATSARMWPSVIKGDDSAFMVEKFQEFVNKDPIAPFFATLWFHAPHAPFVANEEERSLLSQSLEESQEYYCGTAFDSKNRAAHSFPPCRNRPGMNRKVCYQVCRNVLIDYYAAIKSLDAAVGNVRSFLRMKGIADNTIVIFASDNGPARLSNTGRPTYIGPGSTGIFQGFKLTTLEGGVRVPMIVEWPRVVHGPKTVDSAVALFDVGSTLLEVMPGWTEAFDMLNPEAPRMDGVSFASHLRGLEYARTRGRNRGIGIAIGSNAIKALLITKKGNLAAKFDVARTKNAKPKIIKTFSVAVDKFKVTTKNKMLPEAQTWFNTWKSKWASCGEIKNAKKK